MPTLLAVGILLALESPWAMAVQYVVSTEAELRQAIITANNDGDPSSTITLAVSIDVVDPAAFATVTKPLVIDTAGNTLRPATGSGSGLRLTFGGGPITLAGTVEGGEGASGNNFSGNEVAHSDGVLINSGTVRGGKGGNKSFSSSSNSTTGSGGVGLELSGTTFTNTATGVVVGGTGGDITSAGSGSGGRNNHTGNGNIGLRLTGGSLNNQGSIAGGIGGTYLPSASGDNMFAGGGGVGADLSGGIHTNSGAIRGGNGGLGSNSGSTGSGSGGRALTLSNGAVITNSGTIAGGDGRSGPGGSSSGGIGINGSGSVYILTTGAINGGVSGSGARANAVQFDNTFNTLEIHASASITGNVIGSANSTFALGGPTDFTFAVNGLGPSAKYRNFGTVAKRGTSTWTLQNTTTAVQNWAIEGGVLQISSDAQLGGASGTLFFRAPGGTLQTTANVTGARAIVLESLGTFSPDVGTTYTVNSAISGAGGLAQVGEGTLVLTGDNTYGGGTTIAAGTLQLGSATTSGSIPGNVANNGVLVFNRSNANTFSGVISGSGIVSQAGAGLTTLTGANTFSGTTFVRAGSALQVGDGAVSGQIVGNAQVNGLLTFNRSDTFLYGGTIIGDGHVSQIGSGTLIFTGNHTYLGGTDIASGTLQIGNGGTTGSLLGNVVNNGVLVANRSDDILYPGTISGTGVLQQLGPGVLTLAADHTYTGGTLISAGTLRLGSGGLAGSVVGDITDNGALVFDRSDDLLFGNVISGTGNVVKQGSNTLTLAGTNSYSGTTTVAAGTLAVNGAIVSATQVNNGGTLKGTGQVSASVTVAGNGHLAPGGSVGTLTIGGDLFLDAASQLDYELGNPLSANDRTDVGGSLTLDGVLNIRDAGGFFTGVYRIFNYGAALTDNGLDFGALPVGIVPADLQVQTSIANQVNLIVVTGGFGLQYWDGVQTAGNGVIEGGDGAWNTAETHWSAPDGTVNAPWGNGFAVFQGAAGTVTLVEDVRSTGMQFITDGYRIVSGGGQVLAEPALQLRVDPLVTATIDATLVDGAGGPALLTKTGTGTLVLGGANTYSGGTVVEDGVLSVAADTALGAAGSSLTLVDATLQTTASFTSQRPLTVSEGRGILAPVTGTTLTWAGPISGTGNLRKNDAGTLALAGNNTFVGNVTVFGGVVEAGADTAFGNAGNGVYLDGGTLRWSSSFDLASSHRVLLGPLGGQFDTNGNTGTLTQPVEGAGGLTKLGDGTLILAAGNVHTGGTTVMGGTLQVGAGGTTGGLLGDIVNNGIVVANRSDAVVFHGVVSGTGLVEQRGPGMLTLTADNTYTGGTLVSAGTLRLGDGGTTGSVPGNIVDNGELIFDRSDDTQFTGQISGSGHVTKRGGNTLTWTADETYAGGTLIEAGTLMVGNGGSTGSIIGDVVNEGTLFFNRSNDLVYAGTISGAGVLVKEGAGTLQLNGSSNYSGGTTLHAGTLSIASDAALGDPASSLTFTGGNLLLRASFDSARQLFLAADGVIDTQANRNKFAGPIDGPGALTKRGSGELILNGVHEYLGVTRVEAGTLAIGDSAHPGALLLGNGGVVVNAGAFFGGYGGMVGDVDNNGVLGVGNALPAFAKDPDAQFTLGGTLLNTGLVTMLNGVAVDRLAVTANSGALAERELATLAGTYVSNGGRLEMEAVLNEGDVNTQADRLDAERVQVASGPTQLAVRSLGGPGAITLGDGILLVNVADATASAAGAFVLDGRVIAGPYEYLLFQGGLDPGNGNWYLRTLAELAPEPPEPGPEPILRPEIGSYLAAGDVSRRMFVHTLHERLSEPDTRATAERPAWMRIHGVSMRGSAGDGLIEGNGDEFLIHTGLDVAEWETRGEGLMRAGIMAGYGHASIDSTAEFNPATSRVSVDGYAVGAYGTWFANANGGEGLYADGWLQYAWFDNRVSATELTAVDYDTKLGQLSLELGYTVRLGPQLRLQPQVQAIYTWQDDRRLVDTFDTRIALEGESAVGWRGGLHVFREVDTSTGLSPFAELNVWFGGSPTQAAFNTTTIDNDRRDDVYEVSLGLQGAIASGWTLWAKLGQEWDTGDYSRTVGELNLKRSW